MYKLEKISNQYSDIINKLFCSGALSTEQGLILAEIGEKLDNYVHNLKMFPPAIPLYTHQFVLCDDIEKALGFRWDETWSLPYAENDSYVAIKLTDEYEAEILSRKMYAIENERPELEIRQLQNELYLVDYLKQTFNPANDEILVYVHW
jgi:hypothetical protein